MDSYQNHNKIILCKVLFGTFRRQSCLLGSTSDDGSTSDAIEYFLKNENLQLFDLVKLEIDEVLI